MGRTGVITFKGNPMTLEGEDLAVGSPAPAFTLHYAQDGLQALTLDDVKGKPTIISVVPSLDTPTCAVQTKRFNQDLASNEYGNAYNRFTQNQSNAFNRLSGLSGTGQAATQQIGQYGGNMANNVGNLYTQQGNAQAAGQVGSANAWNNAINQGSTLYGASQGWFGKQGGR